MLLRTSILVALAACVGSLPPPPELTVTSPERGLVQGGAGQVTVKGFTRPNIDGDPVTKVLVNDTAATVAADGTFTAVVNVQAGASLLKTTAYTSTGGSATDARAVQVGELRPVGTNIDRAVTATISTDAFAKLSAAAGPLIRSYDLAAKIAPMQPIANLGDSWANVKVDIKQLSFGDIRISLVPVDGGLQFTAEVDRISVSAKADYAGTLVPDGSQMVGMSSDKISLTGTLVVTPAGTSGFTTAITQPQFRATNLRLSASGLVGQIVDLLQNNLSSTVQKAISKGVEKGLDPIMNEALGALAGPKTVDVYGETLDLEATPAAIQFSRDGALVSLNLKAKIANSESSKGFIYTPNGTPTLDVSNGVQLAVSDDLVNGMLAQIHELGMLDLEIEEDFGLFDTARFELKMPPMISANNEDGSLRLVIGDMIASFKDGEKTVIGAAVNAQVDLTILRGTKAEEIKLQFGDIHVWVNVLDGQGTDGEWDLSGAATEGIGAQLDNLTPFLVEVPLPTVAGLTLDNLAMRADSGYVVMSGQIH